MTEQQPMKMAAAEALWETEQPASFSVFTIGTLDGTEDIFSIRIPYLLSFLATGTFDGKVEGINDLQAMEEAQFGPGDYTPNIPITYWTFRWMIGMGALAALAAAWFLFRMRKGRTPAGRTVAARGRSCPSCRWPPTPSRWMFTEIGRQPWIVYGLMATAAGVSPTNDAFMVAGHHGRLHAPLRRAGRRHGGPRASGACGPACPRRPRTAAFEHEAEPALGLGY